MLTGKRFRLKVATLAIDTSGGKRIAITVPDGAIIEVADAPRPENCWMLDVRWSGKTLLMFVEDVQDRGEEIMSRRANA
jgi:hypothetical protein